MDKQDVIAEIYKLTGIGLDKDDPAFLLVELNRLMLDSRADEVIIRLDQSIDKLNQERANHLNELVSTSNEVLARYIGHAREIKKTLEEFKLKPQEAKPSPTVIPTKEPNNALTWMIPASLSIGLLLGAALTFIAIKL
ncbi:hypothetical protein [Methylotenera sp.]|uniref:hypothetical protein n=1 Tax=Methylotenera sp. TaxID=2051956 RepID=UPI00248A0847|nr:hypothetical protein [Methylotenera sp.]MDI1298608.1 hypothetical protein [Methylotenera sp.]